MISHIEQYRPCADTSPIHRLVPRPEDVAEFRPERGDTSDVVTLLSPDEVLGMELTSLIDINEVKGTKMVMGKIANRETGESLPVFIKAIPLGDIGEDMNAWRLACDEFRVGVSLYDHNRTHFLRPYMLVRATLPREGIRRDENESEWVEHILFVREWRDDSTMEFLINKIVPEVGLVDPAFEDPRLDLPLIEKVAADWAEGIELAHQMGIWNLDGGPANIMIENLRPLAERTGVFVTHGKIGETLELLPINVILFDLDSVNRIWPATDGRIVPFTPGYGAPELWRRHLKEVEGISYSVASGNSIDGRVDAFALGVAVYEMLTGTIPYPVMDETITRALDANMMALAQEHGFSILALRNDIARAYIPSLYGVAHFPSLVGNERLERLGVDTRKMDEAFAMVLTDTLETRATPREFASAFVEALHKKNVIRRIVRK